MLHLFSLKRHEEELIYFHKIMNGIEKLNKEQQTTLLQKQWV